jgi:hypothetical protein
MSLEEAERALVDLLFDEAQRAAFFADRAAALAGYALDAEEQADFAALSQPGLELDATMRRDLMLARLSRSFPLSFSIGSALPGGLALLRRLVGPAYARAPRATRSARFGETLRAELAGLSFASDRERALALAFVDTEVAMAWAAARLREQALSGSPPAPAGRSAAPLAADWAARPLALAPHLCMAVLPRSRAALERELCPVELDQLWARLERVPLPAGRLAAALASEQPRLFMARAVLVRASRCEATVEQVTLELSDGFAPLLRALDGSRSADALLSRLAASSAPVATLEAVRAGLRTLLERGMLLAR